MRHTLPRRFQGACLAAAVVAGPALWTSGTAGGSSGTTARLAAHLAVPAAADGRTCAADFVLAATPGSSSVNLSWCQPLNADAPYYGYNVYDGTSPGGESTQVNTTRLGIGATSFDVTGLVAGTTYYFIVQALSKSGSLPSTEASATVAAAASAPGAPTALTATPGTSQVTLSWAAPQSDGGSPVTGYNIYEGTSPSGLSASSAATAGSTSATVTGLTGGSPYYFLITAVNATGESDASNEASATPTGQASGGGHRTGHHPTSGHQPGHHHRSGNGPPASGPPGSGPPASGRPSGRPDSGRHGPGGRPRRSGVASPAYSVSVPVGLLAAAVAAAAAITLAVRRMRARSRKPSAHESAVRVKTDSGPAGQLAAYSTGWQPTVTVRIEPDPGVSSTIVKEMSR